MNNLSKKAFSLSEAIMFLLISTLVMLATMPLITIKHLKLPDRAPHGKWACKLINGQKHSASAANVNAKLPPDEKWEKGCKFPELPNSVTYIIVQAIGGGAAGQRGDIQINQDNKVDVMFADSKNLEYTIEQTGKYEIFLPGEQGKSGWLQPGFFDVILNGFKYMTCSFDDAAANNLVASVTFEYELKRGDKLILELKDVDTNNTYNNKPEQLCDSSKTVLAEWIDEDGVYWKQPYVFQQVKHHPGKNGKLKSLYVKNSEGLKKLVEIKGSGGGYYVSSTDSCSIDCSKRYLSNFDRNSWNIDDYISYLDVPDAKKQFTNLKTARITSMGHTVSYYGGCGGAAGQVNTVLVERPEKKDFDIVIGKGGKNGQDGEDTRFDYISALGGMGCKDKSLNTSIDGTDGEQANTMSALDSVGGKRGEGKIGNPVPSSEKLNGKDASGLGSGGGGGGFALKIDKPIEDYLNSSLLFKLYDYAVRGNGGNGSSGGVIVSW